MSNWNILKQRVHIRDILTDLDKLASFCEHRGYLRGPCPIHLGHNPTAFSVNLERNVWNCFSRCQRGGNVVDLAYLLSDRSWRSAHQWLTRLVERPAEGLRQTDSRITLSPAGSGRNGETGFRPFTRELVLDPVDPFFESRGIEPRTLIRFEAGIWRGDGFLQGCAAVRLHDLSGQPLGYAGRYLDPNRARARGKWKVPRGFPRGTTLYGWHHLSTPRRASLVLVESAWSVMKIFQAGWPNVVAIGGAGIIPEQRSLLQSESAIVLFLDGDHTGRRASNRLRDLPLHPRMKVMLCPLGKDPADLSERELWLRLSPHG